MIDWIPVSERLPEKDGQYLVSNYTSWFGSYDVEPLWYNHDIGFHDHDIEWGVIPAEGVTAWAPLPEPYEEVVE